MKRKESYVVFVFIVASWNNDDSSASEHSVTFSDENYDVEVEEKLTVQEQQRLSDPKTAMMTTTRKKALIEVNPLLTRNISPITLES